MKTPEILFASAVIAAVVGVGATLATRAFEASAARSENGVRAVEHAEALPAAAPDASPVARELVELRMENGTLKERMASLEARLAEVLSTRTPLLAAADDAPASALAASGASDSTVLEASGVTPGFVASVDQALHAIRAKEDAEREQKRKELQAQRIEDRVAKLQQELGLSSHQATDLRTALITADDKREALFAGMRDVPPGGPGDGRDMREGFRAIREETYTTLQGILTPQQLETYKTSEENEFGRRDFGGGGPPWRGGEVGPAGGGDGRRGR